MRSVSSIDHSLWLSYKFLIATNIILPVPLTLPRGPQTGISMSGANSLSVSLKLIKLPAPNNPTLQLSNICCHTPAWPDPAHKNARCGWKIGQGSKANILNLVQILQSDSISRFSTPFHRNATQAMQLQQQQQKPHRISHIFAECDTKQSSAAAITPKHNIRWQLVLGI